MSAQTPVVQDMVGSRIEYVHARPYRYSPIIMTGTITAIEEDKRGVLHFRVRPDASHMLPKWRDETDLIRYLPAQQFSGIEKAASAA